MIPEGYGTGVVYGQRPLTSDSQLTFTRASTATRVGPDGAIAVVGSNVPRIDYTGGGCGKLLLEPQRTNLVTFSEQMDNAAWNKSNASVTANQTTSPSGYDDADLIDALTGTGQHIISAASITYTNAVPYTFSVFAKKGNTSLIQLSGASVVFGSNVWATYNFDTLEVTAGSEATASMVDYGSGWYRLILTGTVTAASTAASFYAAFTNDKSVRLPSFTAANQTFYLWGAQTEQASYATSYIPTSGSTVTRLADVCGKTGISSLINSAEGVLFVEVAALANDGTSRQLSLSDGSSANNKISIIFTSTTNQIQAFIRAAGSISFNSTFTLTNATSLNKLAIKWKLNDFALWVNGTDVATDISGGVPVGLSKLSFDDADGTSIFFSKVQNLIIFPSALSDAQLAELTTI
jgi:hypothetical protein